MSMNHEIVLTALISAVSLLYATVGQAGGTAAAAIAARYSITIHNGSISIK
jgi:hypothetical protein